MQCYVVLSMLWRMILFNIVCTAMKFKCDGIRFKCYMYALLRMVYVVNNMLELTFSETVTSVGVFIKIYFWIEMILDRWVKIYTRHVIIVWHKTMLNNIISKFVSWMRHFSLNRKSFPERGIQESGLTNWRNGEKCRTNSTCIEQTPWIEQLWLKMCVQSGF